MNNDLIDEYFDEIEIEKRKKLMQKILTEKCENFEKYEMVYNYRYAKRPEYKENVLDYFIRGWVLLYSLKNSLKFGVINKKNNRFMNEIKDCFKLDEYYKSDDDLKEIFYKEYVNMTIFYITMALRDKSYGSSLFGIMKMSDEKLIEKIAKEIYSIIYLVPSKFNCFDEMKPIRKAIYSGFKMKFANNYDILEKIINEKKSN